MNRLCRGFQIGFALAWLAALALLVIGTWGLFGQARDPLAAVYLVLLGLPWTRLIDPAPEALRPWLAMAAPGVNLVLLRLICRPRRQ